MPYFGIGAVMPLGEVVPTASPALGFATRTAKRSRASCSMKNGWKRIFAFDEAKWRSNGWRCQMIHTGLAATSAFEDVSPLSVSLPRWKRLAFALLLSGLSVCLPARGDTAGLD